MSRYPKFLWIRSGGSILAGTAEKAVSARGSSSQGEAAYIDSYKLENTILRQDRHDRLFARLFILVY